MLENLQQVASAIKYSQNIKKCWTIYYKRFNYKKMGRTSHRRCSIKKGVLKSFANFTEKKHVLEPSACNFIKNRLQHRCFPKKIAKFFKNTYFCEYLRTIYFPCLLWNDCVIIWLLELSFPITVYLVYNFVYLFIFFQIFLLKRQSEKNFPIAALQKYEGKTITKIIRFFSTFPSFPIKKQLLGVMQSKMFTLPSSFPLPNEAGEEC